MLPPPMSRLLLVCAGGAIGSGARYLVGTWAHATWGAAFPWGTLAVNAVGSFAIALVLVLGPEVGVLRPEATLFLTVGVLGGFTTYSSFNNETLSLAQRGEWGRAAAYVAVTVLAGWVAGVGGLLLGRLVAGE